MAVSMEIVLPTWLVAASLASLLALLVWRTSGVIEPPERPKDAEGRVVIGPHERPKDELDAEPRSAFYVTGRAGRRVHTSKTCRGLRNARDILTSTKHVVGKTPCYICFRGE